MDRAEKIMTALVIAALVAVLANSHRRRGHHGNLTGVDMNMSASPCDDRSGPSYLLSALPDFRRENDFAPRVSR
jgi:hypothetical protein